MQRRSIGIVPNAVESLRQAPLGRLKPTDSAWKPVVKSGHSFQNWREAENYSHYPKPRSPLTEFIRYVVAGLFTRAIFL